MNFCFQIQDKQSDLKIRYILKLNFWWEAPQDLHIVNKGYFENN